MLELQRDYYSFWLAFRRALIKEKDTLVARDVQSLGVEMLSSATTDITSDNSRALFDDLTKGCLQVAASQWSNFNVNPSWAVFGRGSILRSRYRSKSIEERDEPYATRIERIIEVLEELIITGDLTYCGTLFEDILKASQSEFVGKTIIRLYACLLPPLCKLLSKLNQDISVAPFVDFLQKIIAMYLKNVLGDKNQLHHCLLRSIACREKCEDCCLLDTYILDPTTTSKTFRLGYEDSARRRQQHLDERISTAKDVCSSEMSHRSDDHDYVLKVTKNPKIIEGLQWETRLQNAIDFLASIGTDDVIAQIMGPKYQDVTQALSGEKPFGFVSAKRTGSRTARARKRRKT
jgi:hypothetical protein